MAGTKVKPLEPWIFLFFGAFHLHRVWAFVDRSSYADFWLGVMTQKGPRYALFTGILAGLCIAGMVIFLVTLREKAWWRWIYPLCGGYLLFDLSAIAAEWSFWRSIIESMYDISAPYWNILWSAFVLLGCASALLGITLLRQRVLSRKANP